MANPKIVFTGVDQVSSVVNKVGGSITKLQAALAGIAGGLVVNEFLRVVDSLDALEESAQSAGIAVESLSALRYAANQAGVGAEELDAALTKLNVKLDDAANGGKEAQALFKSLGISATNSSGQVLTAEEALGKIADQFTKFRNGPEKAALAVDIFGKAGAKLVPLLNQGSAGLEALKIEAEKAGVVISGNTATAASKFADTMDRLAASLDGIKVSLAGPIIDSLLKMSEEFSAATKSAQGFGEALKLLAKQSAETLADPGEKINKLNAEIDELQKKIQAPAGTSRYKARLDEDLRALEREKKFLQELQRNRALAGFKDDRGDPNLNRFLPSMTPPKRPGGASTKESISADREALSKFVEELQRESDKLEDITTKEKILRLLRANPSIDTAQVRELLASEEKMLDLRLRAVAAKKEDEQIEARILAQQKAVDEQLDTFSGRASDALKMVQTARLEARLAAGEIFKPEELDRMVKGIGGISDEVVKTTDYAEKFALTIESSLGNLITMGGSASDIFKALGQDILKLITQMLILEPLAAELKTLFKGGGGSGASVAGSLLDEILWSFMGGMASGGTLKPGQWAVVGERGPELAFGGTSGQTIVPGGRGGGGVVNVYIDGATDRARIAQLVERGVRAGNAKMVDNMARGGSGLL